MLAENFQTEIISGGKKKKTELKIANCFCMDVSKPQRVVSSGVGGACYELLVWGEVTRLS